MSTKLAASHFYKHPWRASLSRPSSDGYRAVPSAFGDVALVWGPLYELPQSALGAQSVQEARHTPPTRGSLDKTWKLPIFTLTAEQFWVGLLET